MTSKMNKKILFFATSILLIAFSLFLFRETFLGMELQGVDDNISMRTVIARSLLSGQGYHFIPNYWLGFIFNIPNPDLYNTILNINGTPQIIMVYIIALLLSLVMSFKLLKRLDVSDSGSLFGSISYTFLPHVLSLVYSGHVLAIEAIPMTPAFLYCVSVIVDGQTKSKLSKILAGVWGGIFWAWMMIGEPQRGTYGTVLGLAWTIYLLVKTNSIFFKKIISTPKEFLPITTITHKIAYLILILIFGIGIFSSTIGFWKNSEFLANEGSWDFATSWSFPPTELMDTFAFGYHGLSSTEPKFPYHGDKPLSGNTDSLGFFLLFFFICGVILAWKSQKKGIRFFAISGLIALLLAFGKYFPGTPFFWLWYQIPGMDTMRVPAKFLSITALCWSVVASMGLDSVVEFFRSEDKKKKQLFLYIIIAIAVISIIWYVMLLVTDGGDSSAIRKVLGRNRATIQAAIDLRIQSIGNMAALFSISALIFVLVFYRPKILAFVPIMFVALTLYNVYKANRFYIERAYVDEKSFYPKTELISFLEKHLGLEYRASGSLFLPNLTSGQAPLGDVIEQQLYPLNNNDLTYSFPYYDINMFGRIPISRSDEGYVNFFKSPFDSVPVFQNYDDVWEMNKRLWFIGNVKYIIVGEETRQVFASQLQKDTLFITNLIGSYDQEVSIFELKNKLPRFAIIQSVKPVYDLYLFPELTDSLKNIEQFVLPIEDAGYEVTNFLYTVPIPVVPQRVNYNAYQMDVQIDRDSVLYFGDLFDIGWKAKVNGVETKLYRANGIQQYLWLPAGAHNVEIFYHRPVKGLLLSRVVIVLAMLAVVIVYIKNLITSNKKV